MQENTNGDAPAEVSEDQPRAVEEAGAPSRPQEAPATKTSRKKRRVRTVRTFPACSFKEALPLAEAILSVAAGQRVRRLTLFEQLGRSADSGPSHQLITNSSQYGLTKGGYSAEFLELTEEGRLAVGDDSLGRAKVAARLELAIARISPFSALYEHFKNNRVPTISVLRDFAIDQNLAAEDNADECIETFLANARDLDLLRTYAGAERLLTFEHLLDELGNEALRETDDQETDEVDVAIPKSERPPHPPVARQTSSLAQVIAETSDLSKVCFLVSPIGSEGSPERKHADLVLGSLIEPALTGLGLRLVRADKISTPGMITAQVIDHLVRAPLVIADLSFGNPNVFYELALRHASRRPVVQIVRAGDHLPFDVGQFRTVPIDMTDIFTLVPQIDSYRAEIARQCRAAMQDPDNAESPLSLFYPKFWDQFDTPK